MLPAKGAPPDIQNWALGVGLGKGQVGKGLADGMHISQGQVGKGQVGKGQGRWAKGRQAKGRQMEGR